MEIEKKIFDLEDIWVKFACLCLDICDLLPNSKAGQNIGYQLSKSSAAPALMYGEAQAAESTNDFIHTMKMSLKEIRETRVNLKIIKMKPLVVHPLVDKTLDKANRLMAIFLKSIETAKLNRDKARGLKP